MATVASNSVMAGASGASYGDPPGWDTSGGTGGATWNWPNNQTWIAPDGTWINPVPTTITFPTTTYPASTWTVTSGSTKINVICPHCQKTVEWNASNICPECKKPLSIYLNPNPLSIDYDDNGYQKQLQYNYEKQLLEYYEKCLKEGISPFCPAEKGEKEKTPEPERRDAHPGDGSRWDEI